MMKVRSSHRAPWLAALAAISLGIAGCNAPADGSAATDGSAAEGVTYRAADGTCEVPPLDGVNFEAASEFVAYFEEESSGLPMTEPLPESLSPDTTVAYLDNGSAVSAIIWSGLQKAAKTAGVQLQQVDAGLNAQSVSAAVNSVVENAPDILVAAAVDATFYQNQLEALHEAGTTIVYAGSSNAEQFGLLDSHSGYGASIINGEVLAASAIAFTCGTGTDFVFYNIPELVFSQVQLDAATAYLQENCPECNLRTVDIPISTMDTTAGDAIISDLQAHPETDFFITVSDQMQIGLKAKQDLAGVNVPGMGQSSLPPNIEQLRTGLQAGGFAVDYNAYAWLMLDEGLRRHQGMDVTYEDWQPWVKAISRIVTPESADEYPKGFATYAGFEGDLAKMWGKTS